MTIYVTEPEMLVRFVDGLKVAAGSAHQLAHAQSNPQWLQVRDLLESLINSGQKLAVSKAMPRQEVLQQLDLRQMKDRKERPN